jgi:hypothetical protein
MRYVQVAANFCNNLRLASGLWSQLMVYSYRNQFAGQRLLRQQQKGKAIGAARNRTQ